MKRGGSWNNNEDNSRVSNRNNNTPDNRNNNIGFRPVNTYKCEMLYVYGYAVSIIICPDSYPARNIFPSNIKNPPAISRDDFLMLEYGRRTPFLLNISSYQEEIKVGKWGLNSSLVGGFSLKKRNLK